MLVAYKAGLWNIAHSQGLKVHSQTVDNGWKVWFGDGAPFLVSPIYTFPQEKQHRIYDALDSISCVYEMEETPDAMSLVYMTGGKVFTIDSNDKDSSTW